MQAAQAAAVEQEQQMASLLDALEQAQGEQGEEEAAEEEPEDLLGAGILDAQSERGMELRQQIRDFAEQSPEIAAQMLRNWLNGGEMDGRRDG